jgi:murein DD-endopeptidase MepM/ murein hydrolase activator NlpD
MRRTFWVSITLGLAALLALPLAGSTKPSLDERIDDKRDQVNRQLGKEGRIREGIGTYDRRISSLQREIGGLERRQGKFQRRLDKREAELRRIRGRLLSARARLVRLRAELRRSEDALAARLVELYKADQPDVLTVLLEADGFGDLLERTAFLERISAQDQHIVTRVRDLKAEVKRQVDYLGVLEQQAQTAADAVRARRNEIAASKKSVQRRRDALARTREGKRQALSRTHAHRKHLEGDLSALEREQARIRRALIGAQGGSGGPVRKGSGNFIWPVNGPVTSGFGMRWGRLHAGIDIGAASGTPIRAADSGRVVLMGAQGGYGNNTCVSHGGSTSTCYAHQSGFATSQGASVKQGQVIGYVGCTGHCFGDHLHFEVRINGSPVDPMGYL